MAERRVAFFAALISTGGTGAKTLGDQHVRESLVGKHFWDSNRYIKCC